MNKMMLMLLLLLTSCTLYAAELRDPTQPPPGVANMQAKQGQALVVTSIIISANRRIALINGQFVKEGENIAGSKVIAIKRDYVELSSQGQKVKLYLIKQDVRKRR
jgi:MSHA biogenesis protein MshK